MGLTRLFKFFDSFLDHLVAREAGIEALHEFKGAAELGVPRVSLITPGSDEGERKGLRGLRRLATRRLQCALGLLQRARRLHVSDGERNDERNQADHGRDVPERRERVATREQAASPSLPATSRSSDSCRATYTAPIPPCPSGETIWKSGISGGAQLLCPYRSQ